MSGPRLVAAVSKSHLRDGGAQFALRAETIVEELQDFEARLAISNRTIDALDLVMIGIH
jgi:hypothetical protein